MFQFIRKALEAADNILITLRYPANPKALTVKGEALYNMGDFEHALVCFHRAMKNANTRVLLIFIAIRYSLLENYSILNIILKYKFNIIFNLSG